MRGFSGSLLLLFVASLATADVVRLTNGDRVSGKVVGKTARRVRLQTPYGLLVVPRDQVEKIERDDGSVELVTGPVEARPNPAPPPPQPARLHVVVAGHSFWQAWDPKSAPVDPSLRFELRLDARPLASYTDVNLDPEDLPKAVVNSFVFSPERVFVAVAQDVVAGPPLIAKGEIGLGLKLPGELAGPHRLEIGYQVNDGTTSAPQWRDVVTAGTPIVLAAGAATVVTIRQNRGAMEYAKRKMRGVDSFSAALEAEVAPATAP